MNRYNPTKKRSGLVEVPEYGHTFFTRMYGLKPRIIGNKLVKKGTILPIRDLEFERNQYQKEMLRQMMEYLGIKQCNAVERSLDTAAK